MGSGCRQAAALQQGRSSEGIPRLRVWADMMPQCHSCECYHQQESMDDEHCTSVRILALFACGRGNCFSAAAFDPPQSRPQVGSLFARFLCAWPFRVASQDGSSAATSEQRCVHCAISRALRGKGTERGFFGHPGALPSTSQVYN